MKYTQHNSSLTKFIIAVPVVIGLCTNLVASQLSTNFAHLSCATSGSTSSVNALPVGSTTSDSPMPDVERKMIIDSAAGRSLQDSSTTITPEEDVLDPKLTQILAHPYLLPATTPIQKYDFSDDQKYLVVVYTNNLMQIYDLVRMKPIGKPLKGSSLVQISRNNRFLSAVYTDTSSIQIYNLQTAEPAYPRIKYFGQFRSNPIVISPDSSLCAIKNSENCSCQLYKLDTGKPIHKPFPNTYSFSLKDKYLNVYDQNEQAQIYHIATGKKVGQPLPGGDNWQCSQCLRDHHHSHKIGEFSKEETDNLLYFVDGSHTLNIYNSETGEPACTPIQNVAEYKLDSEENILFTLSPDFSLSIYDLKTWKPVMDTSTLPDLSELDLAHCHVNNKSQAILLAFHQFFIFGNSTGLRIFKGSYPYFSQDGRFIMHSLRPYSKIGVSVSYNILTNTSVGFPDLPFTEHAETQSNEARNIFITQGDNRICVYDLSSGKIISTFTLENWNSERSLWELSISGNYLFHSNSDSEQVYDITSGKLIHAIQLVNRNILCFRNGRFRSIMNTSRGIELYLTRKEACQQLKTCSSDQLKLLKDIYKAREAIQLTPEQRLLFSNLEKTHPFIAGALSKYSLNNSSNSSTGQTASKEQKA